MFFKKSHSAQEIEASVFESLPLPQSEEDGLQVALQSLADSAEIFEAMNLPEEAEVITQFMETIASGQFAMVKEAKKKAKKKTKSKSKTKPKTTTKKKPSTLIDIVKDITSEVLTPEKQVDNLENVGWVFNAPKSDCGECSMADDDGPISGIQEISADNDNDIPLEYEKCPECRYDHTHEAQKAFDAHFPSELSEEESDEYRRTSIEI